MARRRRATDRFSTRRRVDSPAWRRRLERARREDARPIDQRLTFWSPGSFSEVRFEAEMRSRRCEPTGRRKAPRDDRLREAIHGAARQAWIASSRTPVTG